MNKDKWVNIKTDPPPYYYSIITGSIIFPIAAYFITVGGLNTFGFIIVLIMGFGIPFMLSCINWRIIIKERSDGRSFLLFGPEFTKENISNIYIPAWKRTFVIFLSFVVTVIAILLIKKT